MDKRKTIILPDEAREDFLRFLSYGWLPGAHHVHAQPPARAVPHGSGSEEIMPGAAGAKNK